MAKRWVLLDRGTDQPAWVALNRLARACPHCGEPVKVELFEGMWLAEATPAYARKLTESQLLDDLEDDLDD